MKLDKDNSILCVWPATTVGPDDIQDFNEWLKEEFSVTGEYLEGIETLPDAEPGSGGRIDRQLIVHRPVQSPSIEFSCPTSMANSFMIRS